MNKFGKLISVLVVLMLFFTALAVVSLDHYKLQAGYDLQESATMFVPKETVVSGTVFVANEAFHDFSSEVVTEPEFDEDGDNYIATSDAIYSDLLGGHLEFGFVSRHGELTCPSFLIWRGVFFFKASPCEEHRIYG